MTFKVIYDPDYGQTVPDGMVDSFARQFIDGFAGLNIKRLRVTVGTETMFTRFRLAVVRKELDIKDVEFFIKDQPVIVTSYGGMNNTINPFNNELWLNEIFETALSVSPMSTHNPPFNIS